MNEIDLNNLHDSNPNKPPEPSNTTTTQTNLHALTVMEYAPAPLIKE